MILVEWAVHAVLWPGGRFGILAVVFVFLLQPHDFGLQPGELHGDFRLPGLDAVEEQVVLLRRVLGEVKHLIGVLFPVVDELVRGGADAEMRGGVVIAGRVVVAEVKRGAPVGRRFAAQQRHERAALHRVRHGQPGEAEEGGREVDVADELRGHMAGLDAGAARDQRRAQARLIREAFVVKAEVAEIPAVVRGVDDDGVLREARLVEVVEHTAHAVVHALHAGEVVLHVTLVFPLREFLAGVGFLRAVGCSYLDFHRLEFKPLRERGAFEIGGRFQLEITTS